MAEYATPFEYFAPNIGAAGRRNESLAAIEAMRQKQGQRTMDARALVGPILMQLLQSQGQGGPPQLPPPPGTTSGPMPPGVGQGSIPMGPPVRPAAAAPQAAPSAPAMPPPYQSLPREPLGGPPTEDQGLISEPPGAQPAGPATPQGPQRRDLASIVQVFKAQGIPDELMIDALDAITPALSAENKQELDLYKAHTTAMKQAQDIYVKTFEAETGALRANIQLLEHQRRTAQGDERNRIARERINKSLGGSENVKRSVPVFDAEGTQTGWNVLTKGGQSFQFDMDGNKRGPETTPGPKADVNRLRQVNALRGELATLESVSATQSGPERAKTRARMTAIQRQLEQLNVPTPRPAPKPAAGPEAAPPTNPAEREVGKVYTLPRGKFKWTAAGWVQP